MNQHAHLLEICCFSLESAIIAEKSGADRIEFCDNPAEGGTTPSYGSLKIIRNHIHIPVFPIIRPRGGHFVYTASEFEIMKQDILLCKSLGFEGVVIGMLDANGHVDLKKVSLLVEMAYPMDVTFHRAFDRTKDPLEALEQIIQTGCTRILTSGQHSDVNQSIPLIQLLIKEAKERICIMPGAGIKSDSFSTLIKQTGAKEFHASARKIVTEPYFSPSSMEESITMTEVSSEEVIALKNLLKHYTSSIHTDSDSI